MRALVAGMAGVAVLGLTAGAQELARPAGWRWALDEPAAYVTRLKPPAGSFLFGTMPPGWHITTGPGAVLYDPARVADGQFTLEAELFLFPGGSQDGFGVFVGGTGLDDAGGSYTAFLVRRDGSAVVTARRRGETEDVHPWMRHDAIAVQQGETDAKYVLRVAAGLDTVRFLVNGVEVVALPREGLAVDGVIGFRIGRDINLHAAKLDLTHHLAPAAR